MYENGRWVSAFFGPSNEMKWLSWVCHGGEHDIWIEREEIEEEEQHHFLWIIYPPWPWCGACVCVAIVAFPHKNWEEEIKFLA